MTSKSNSSPSERSFDSYETLNKMLNCIGLPPYTPLEFEDTTTALFEQEEQDLSNYGECLFGPFPSVPTYLDDHTGALNLPTQCAQTDQTTGSTEKDLEGTHGQSSGDYGHIQDMSNLAGGATVTVDPEKVQVGVTNGAQRKQKELTLTIGYGIDIENLENVPDYIVAFEEALIEEVCELCGGCTALSGDGYWKPDAGTDRKDTYTAATEREYCLTLKISCEETKVETVYESLKEAVSKHKQAVNIAYPNKPLDIEWIHCVETETVGRHFRC